MLMKSSQPQSRDRVRERGPDYDDGPEPSSRDRRRNEGEGVELIEEYDIDNETGEQIPRQRKYQENDQTPSQIRLPAPRTDTSVPSSRAAQSDRGSRSGPAEQSGRGRYGKNPDRLHQNDRHGERRPRKH